MAEQRDKTVSYRRAEWLVAHPASINLSSCIRDAAKKRTTIPERTIARGGGQFIRLASILNDAEGGCYLHLTIDTPGESASVVPKVTPGLSAFEVSTTAPPSDSEFMDGDAFIYVRKNDVCLCTTATSDAAVRYFLSQFFVAAALRHDADKFELMKVADVGKIALLQSQGVKEVELRATTYKATADYTRRKGQPSWLLSEVWKQTKAILGVPHDVNEDALQVTLSLTADRRRKGIVLGEKRLETLAISAIETSEDEDDFVIITKSGQRISRKEIYLRTKVTVDKLGKSVHHEKVWNELKKFYEILESSGALEQ